MVRLCWIWGGALLAAACTASTQDSTDALDAEPPRVVGIRTDCPSRAIEGALIDCRVWAVGDEAAEVYLTGGVPGANFVDGTLSWQTSADAASWAPFVFEAGGKQLEWPIQIEKRQVLGTAAAQGGRIAIETSSVSQPNLQIAVQAEGIAEGQAVQVVEVVGAPGTASGLPSFSIRTEGEPFTAVVTLTVTSDAAAWGVESSGPLVMSWDGSAWTPIASADTSTAGSTTFAVPTEVRGVAAPVAGRSHLWLPGEGFFETLFAAGAGAGAAAAPGAVVVGGVTVVAGIAGVGVIAGAWQEPALLTIKGSGGAPGRTCVLVHGILADPSTFYPTSDAAFPQPATAECRDDATLGNWASCRCDNVLALQYPWGRSANTNGEHIARLLSVFDADHPYYLIAHSNGGLVSRAAIENARPELLQEGLQGLITIGTPHQGGDLPPADWLAYARWYSTLEQAIEAFPGDDPVEAVDWLGRKLFPGIRDLSVESWQTPLPSWQNTEASLSFLADLDPEPTYMLGCVAGTDESLTAVQTDGVVTRVSASGACRDASRHNWLDAGADLAHGQLTHNRLHGLAGVNGVGAVLDDWLGWTVSCPEGDVDLDGVCDSEDQCLGNDAIGDADGDLVCDDRDICLGDDALGDADGDGRCGDAVDCQPGTTYEDRQLGVILCIPAGTFTMGCLAGRDDDLGCNADETPHEVTLTRAFQVMEAEITQAQYEAVMGDNPSYFRDATLPLDSVTWNEVVAFADAVSVVQGLAPCGTGDPYACDGWRLPTEAEWEYSARGGEGFLYSGSDDLDAVAWHSGNSNRTTHAGCGRTRNGFGLCDLSGNVMEWTLDWRAEYPFGVSVDPLGASSGSIRVIRGGSYGALPRGARVAFRGGDSVGFWESTLGARLVRSVP
jgi:sulfatase modifying factor 1